MLRQLLIKELRPNNWYLDQEKVEQIRQIWRNERSELLPPCLVTLIDGEWSLIDGHSRAFVAYEKGIQRLGVEVRPLHELGGNTLIYEFIHRMGPKQGVSSISDLQSRILSAQDYQLKWIEFCQFQSKLLETNPTSNLFSK